jgi:hypothetical protein
MSESSDDRYQAQAVQKTSSTIPNSHHCVAPRIDSALELADKQLRSETAPVRALDVRVMLKARLNLAHLDRLAYQPQPMPFTTPGFEDDAEACGDGVDWSLQWLNSGAVCFWSKEQYREWKTVLDHIKDMGMHFLTVLDTAASLPLSAHSATVTAALDAFILIFKHSKSRTKLPWTITNTEDQFKIRIRRYRVLAFTQRLVFYNARLKGKSMVEYDADIAHMRGELGTTPDFSIVRELQTLWVHYEQREDEVTEAFKESTQLEWTGPLIPVENVTALVEYPDGVECIICRYQLTPPGVFTAPCKHSYCQTCLEHWIHAAEKASHTCPYCRTELFPKPQYRPKESQGARNYQKELEEIMKIMDSLSTIFWSDAWLKEEVALQRLYERETGVNFNSSPVLTTE